MIVLISERKLVVLSGGICSRVLPMRIELQSWLARRGGGGQHGRRDPLLGHHLRSGSAGRIPGTSSSKIDPSKFLHNLIRDGDMILKHVYVQS
jgi:hypothetical protein